MTRAQAMSALDGPDILEGARTAILEHGSRAADAVVLLHGITNHPGQYARFAPEVFARGANVIVPRMPGHGSRDRLTNELATLTAEQLLATAYEALDIAAGLGERVHVLGISMGGLLAAYAAQFRHGIATAVPVAPDFALLHFSYGFNKLAERVFLAMPNFFLWWDPRLRAAQRPRTAYPRFPTHALMQTLRIGDDVYAESRKAAPVASKVVTIVNAADPAVNNEVTERVVSQWKNRRTEGIEYVTMRDLPENHDIIDPDNPRARIDLVYPALLDGLFGAKTS